MSDSVIPLTPTLQQLLGKESVSMADVREVVAMLQGESIIDWPLLHFRSLPAVNEFLRVLQVRPDSASDVERLVEVHARAVRYVRNHLNIQVPGVIASPHMVQNLFLYASSNNIYSQMSFMILKVMLIINHLEAGELLFNLPISERVLFALLDQRVSQTIGEMQFKGFPIHEFMPSRKTEDSLITKMLSKKHSIATRVFDKIRFRLIVNNIGDIVPALFYLKQNLVPFTYVVPGESTNTIAPISQLLEASLNYSIDCADVGARPAFNRFTHKDFRVINFVADIPIRIDDLVGPGDSMIVSRFGHIVFIPTEFQIFDRDSYYTNEAGPASHSLYKERQIQEVLRRIYTPSDSGSRD